MNILGCQNTINMRTVTIFQCNTTKPPAAVATQLDIIYHYYYFHIVSSNEKYLHIKVKTFHICI